MGQASVSRRDGVDAGRGSVTAAGFVLALLAASYAVSYFDRMMMIVVGELVKTEFQLSDKQLSLLTGATFVIMFGVAGIGAGWMVDRFNRKRLWVSTLSFFSVMTAACGMAGGFGSLAAARLGVGVGEAAGAPVAMSLIGDIYPERKRPMAVALFYAGGMVGLLAAFPIGGWIAQLWGWRAAFWLAAPLGVVIAIMIALTVREPPRAGAPAADAPRHSSFRLIFGNRALVWLLAGSSLAAFFSTGMLQWLPMYFMRQHNMAMTEIGLLFGPVLGVGMLAGLLLGGVVGNRLARHSTAVTTLFCAFALLGVVPLYLLLLWTPSTSLALAMMFAATATSALLSPCFLSASQSICDPRVRGAVAGVVNFLSSLIGGAVLPFAVGALSDVWSPQLGAAGLKYALAVICLTCLPAVAFFALSSWVQRQAARTA